MSALSLFKRNRLQQASYAWESEVKNMGFYVYRKFYFPQATNIWDAFDYLREAEEKGIIKDFFISQWAKDEEEVDKAGWIREIKKQLGGK